MTKGELENDLRSVILNARVVVDTNDLVRDYAEKLMQRIDRYAYEVAESAIMESHGSDLIMNAGDKHIVVTGEVYNLIRSHFLANIKEKTNQ